MLGWLELTRGGGLLFERNTVSGENKDINQFIINTIYNIQFNKSQIYRSAIRKIKSLKLSR